MQQEKLKKSAIPISVLDRQKWYTIIVKISMAWNWDIVNLRWVSDAQLIAESESGARFQLFCAMLGAGAGLFVVLYYGEDFINEHLFAFCVGGAFVGAILGFLLRLVIGFVLIFGLLALMLYLIYYACTIK